MLTHVPAMLDQLIAKLLFDMSRVGTKPRYAFDHVSIVGQTKDQDVDPTELAHSFVGTLASVFGGLDVASR
jgi:hypothetical protein